MLERTKDGLAGRLHRAHEFHDDVDVLARGEFLDVVGEQLDGDAAALGDAAHSDAAQHHGCADTSGEVISAVLDDPDNFAADVAQPEYRYTDRLFVTGHSSPHFQTQ